MQVFRYVILCVTAALPATVFAQAREEARMLVATQVVEEMTAMPDQGVPDWLLARAHGIAVVPDVVKVGLGVGGRRGKGLLVVRDSQGRWTNPVFITLTGGSFGWQAGVQSTDVILVFTSAAGVEGITDGKLTLGADASVAAGPVGRQASAATDPNLSAEVYSYSRAMGLFAGVAIDGTAITIDRKGNAAFYNKRDITAEELMAEGAPTPPPAAQRYLSTLDQATRTASAATPATGEAPATPATPAPVGTDPASAPASTPEAGAGAKTFPMEDPNPGQEPPG
jgi:lipid-binding SYLF domain-containing protein